MIKHNEKAIALCNSHQGSRDSEILGKPLNPTKKLQKKDEKYLFEKGRHIYLQQCCLVYVHHLCAFSVEFYQKLYLLNMQEMFSHWSHYPGLLSMFSAMTVHRVDA